MGGSKCTCLQKLLISYWHCHAGVLTVTWDPYSLSVLQHSSAFVGASIKENSNFTDIINLKSSSSLSSVRRPVCNEPCWFYPWSLPPSLPRLLRLVLRFSQKERSVAVVGGGCCSGSRARPPGCCTVVVWWPWEETQKPMLHPFILRIK